MKKIADFCDVCGNKFHGTFVKKNGEKMFLCCKHLHHMKRYGKILLRTRMDKNEIRIKNDYYEMDLYDKSVNIIARTIFDKENLVAIKQYKWTVSLKGKKYYVRTDANNKHNERKTLYLANLIIGKRKGYQVDHINGDTLDNRGKNLRFCTQQQNLMNKSDARGIWWNKQMKKWEAYISVNNKKIGLGYYTNEKEALNIRRKAELKYFGKFAPKHS